MFLKTLVSCTSLSNGKQSFLVTASLRQLAGAKCVKYSDLGIVASTG